MLHIFQNAQSEQPGWANPLYTKALDTNILIYQWKDMQQTLHEQ